MDVRRVLVMVAIGMVALTLLAALSAPSDRGDGDSVSPAPAPARPATPTRTISFRHPPPRSAPVRRVRPGTRLVVRVVTTAPGQAEIASLGLLQAADPSSPAVFDVLGPRPGRYEVTLTPVEGPRSRVGVVEVEVE